MDDSAPTTNRTQTQHPAHCNENRYLQLIDFITHTQPSKRTERTIQPSTPTLIDMVCPLGTGLGSMHIHYPAITTTTIGGAMSTETNGRTDGRLSSMQFCSTEQLLGVFFLLHSTLPSMAGCCWLFLFCAWARSSETDYPHSNWGLGWFGLLLCMFIVPRGLVVAWFCFGCVVLDDFCRLVHACRWGRPPLLEWKMAKAGQNLCCFCPSVGKG